MSARRSMTPTEENVSVFINEAEARNFLRENMLVPTDKPRKTTYGYSRGYFCPCKARRDVRCRFAATGFGKNGEFRVVTRYKHNHKVPLCGEKVEVILDSNSEASDEEMPTSSNSRPTSGISTDNARRFTRSQSRGPAAPASKNSPTRRSTPKHANTTSNSPDEIILGDSDEEKPTSSNGRPTTAGSTDNARRFTRSASRGPAAPASKNSPIRRSTPKPANTTSNSPDESILDDSDEETPTSSNGRPTTADSTNDIRRFTRSQSRGPAAPTSENRPMQRSALKPANNTSNSPDENILDDSDEEMPTSSNSRPTAMVRNNNGRFMRSASRGPAASASKRAPARLSAQKQANSSNSPEKSDANDSDEEMSPASKRRRTTASSPKNTVRFTRSMSRGPGVPASVNPCRSALKPANNTSNSPDESISLDSDDEMPTCPNDCELTGVIMTNNPAFYTKSAFRPPPVPAFRNPVSRRAALERVNNASNSPDKFNNDDSDGEMPTSSIIRQMTSVRFNRVTRSASRGPFAGRGTPESSNPRPNFKTFLAKYGGELVKIAMQHELILTINSITNASIIFTHSNGCTDLEFTALDNNEVEVRSGKYVPLAGSFYKIDRKRKENRKNLAKFLATIRELCYEITHAMF